MEIIFIIGVVWLLYVWFKNDSNAERKSGPDRSEPPPKKIADTQSRSGGAPVTGASRTPNAALIQQAIDQNKTLKFRYIDQDGEITHRTVTPDYLERRHDVLCLVAHCHLRNAERTFVVRKMQHVTAQ